ncbi:TonB-dependent receptor [Inhella gelatinilytica]|uniref:TonB-dependent receptor n=1 Tax=Inhella gelatinilytica TaxID=2795030 RepID=A0A931J042_9BURK|nr:TonB-dependent receptor [Inhella gelatinilytica]MBH9553738.1 TonB-dependent receptor [Inhella gelatinilytica]
MRPNAHVLLLLLGSTVSSSGWGQEADTLEKVTITLGRGQIRSVLGLSRSEFSQSLAGTSPLSVMARLPGASFQAADGLGNYEWSARFAMRGFAQSQLGFTLDDIPLGDMSYGNHNGLHISRAIASENLGQATLSQGAGSLDTASTSNLGGTVQFYSIDPRREAAFQLQQTLGANDQRRSFMRWDSGEGAWGAFSVSLADHRNEKWKGAGEQQQRQVNLKWVRAMGSHRLSAFFNTSDRQEVDYQDMSLEMIQRLGWDWDNSYPDFNAALTASRTLCGNAGSTYTPRCDDAYFAGSGLRKDRLAGAQAAFQLAPDLTWRNTIYTHRNEGRGLWFTPYTASPDGTPISVRTTEYDIDRQGWISHGTAEWGNHKVVASFWIENNRFDQARRFYASPASAVPNVYRFPTHPFRTDWVFEFDTRTQQFSLADTWTLSERLSLGWGFKSMRVVTDATLLEGSNRPTGTIRSSKPFLPQIGLLYTAPDGNEWFASLTRNARAFQAAGAGTTPFATTAAGFEAVKNRLRPETSDSFELGWRRIGPTTQWSLTAYSVTFRDRLLSVQAGSAIVGNPSILSNVGTVKSRGFEAAVSHRLSKLWSVYGGLSLLNARYQDDVTSGGTTVATAGKRVVDAPAQMLKLGLQYDEGPWSATTGVDLQAKRYYTYTNDAHVPGYALINAQIGYRWGQVGVLSDAQARLSVHNLGNRRYIATLGSNGFVNSDPSGTAQTLLPGAPRLWSATLSARF